MSRWITWASTSRVFQNSFHTSRVGSQRDRWDRCLAMVNMTEGHWCGSCAPCSVCHWHTHSAKRFNRSATLPSSLCISLPWAAELFGSVVVVVIHSKSNRWMKLKSLWVWYNSHLFIPSWHTQVVRREILVPFVKVTSFSSGSDLSRVINRWNIWTWINTLRIMAQMIFIFHLNEENYNRLCVCVFVVNGNIFEDQVNNLLRPDPRTQSD